MFLLTYYLLTYLLIHSFTHYLTHLHFHLLSRVRIAVGKIQGRDPVALLLEDLSMNPMVQEQKSLKGLKRILNGALDSNNVKGREGKEGATASQAVLSVGEQMDVLMALSTDPDVLSRQYLGLNTWL